MGDATWDLTGDWSWEDRSVGVWLRGLPQMLQFSFRGSTVGAFTGFR